MTTEYKKAQRAAVNKAFAEKQAKLGLKSYRFSLPEGVHQQFADMSEHARAEYYYQLLDKGSDEELQIMAESNRAAPLTEAQREAAQAQELGDLLCDHDGYARMLEDAESAALAAKEAGNSMAAVKHGARAFVAASYLRIFKNKILTELKQPVDK